MAAPAHPPVFWRLVVTNLMGQAITLITGTADDIRFQFRLNRPDMLTFTLPSEDPLTNLTVDDDGLPYVACGVRMVKAFRKTGTEPGGWVLRFVGRVWTVEDDGDGSTVRTNVTCYSPLHLLGKRLIRDADGTVYKQVKWWDTPGAHIFRDMVERTHVYKGSNIGLDDTSSGTWDGSTADQTVGYDQAYILPNVITLCDTGTMDIVQEYQNSEDGKHLRLGAIERVGEEKPAVIFGYAAPPRTASKFNRLQTMDDLYNDITLWGKSTTGHRANVTDAVSKAAFGTFELAEVLADVETKELVEYLADERLNLQKDIRDMVTVIPAPEISAVPFDGWGVGDTIRVNAARPPLPVTRQLVSGFQRVYGFDLEVGKTAGESVTGMIVSSQGI